jgi:tetratricopeptide (TPR) repeat protein
MYRQVGDLGQAISLLSDNLAGCERVLGDEHPDTIAARGNLATALEERGDYARALQLYESVVVSYTALLGAWHPDTIAARNNLASLHWSIGDLDRAIAQLESLREDASRALGDGHLDTLIIENNLGAAYFVDGRFTQAEALFEHLVDIYGAASFAESELLLAQHNLATVRIQLGRLEEAITMLQSVVRGRETLLGEDHADTRASRTRLREARIARGG